MSVDVYILLRKAKSLYYCQYSRCYNTRNRGFSYYGKKGIKIEYNKNDFLIWFINEAKNIPEQDLCLYSVGRINHDKNYSFDNIKLQLISENSSEVLKRRGNPSPWKNKPVSCYKNGVLIGTYDSASEAGRSNNYDVSAVIKHCKGIYKKSKTMLTFEYCNK